MLCVSAVMIIYDYKCQYIIRFAHDNPQKNNPLTSASRRGSASGATLF
jgi:hypothetical protein